MEPAEIRDSKEGENRPLAHFSPSVWGDYFETYSLDHALFESYSNKVETLKAQVKEMLLASSGDFLESVKLIEVLSHLGISYHFETYIEEQLQSLFNTTAKFLTCQNDYNLHDLALVFRVFRHNGHNISSNVFEKFKDSNGRFKESICGDIKGLLSLFEATQVRLHGEDILEEALVSTTYQLKPIASDPNHPLAKQVEHTLEFPIMKSIPRVEARYFIPVYEQDETRNETLLELAKIDFNLVQMLHRQELAELTRWQKGMIERLPYARDRVAELYFWAMTVNSEPRYGKARMIFAKDILVLSYVDDTYDAYGTPSELDKLTEAAKEWNPAAAEGLPDYLQYLYKKVILGLYEEFRNDLDEKEGKSYMIEYAKQEMIALMCAYHQENKWYKDGYVPKLEEYLIHAFKSSGNTQLMTIICLGLAGPESVDWIKSRPKLLKAADTIGRLSDDCMSQLFEKERGHCVSAMECYMHEHGVNEEEAVKKLREMIENAWKDINGEFMRPTALPRQLLLTPTGLCRSYHLIYKHTDGYTDSKYLKNHIKALYVDPIPL